MITTAHTQHNYIYNTINLMNDQQCICLIGLVAQLYVPMMSGFSQREGHNPVDRKVHDPHKYGILLLPVIYPIGRHSATLTNTCRFICNIVKIDEILIIEIYKFIKLFPLN